MGRWIALLHVVGRNTPRVCEVCRDVSKAPRTDVPASPAVSRWFLPSV